MIKTVGAHRLWLDLLFLQLFRSTSSKGTLQGAQITSQRPQWILLVSFSRSFRAVLQPASLQSTELNNQEEW